jgi:hypothetical protein
MAGAVKPKHKELDIKMMRRIYSLLLICLFPSISAATELYGEMVTGTNYEIAESANASTNFYSRFPFWNGISPLFPGSGGLELKSKIRALRLNRVSGVPCTKALNILIAADDTSNIAQTTVGGRAQGSDCIYPIDESVVGKRFWVLIICTNDGCTSKDGGMKLSGSPLNQGLTVNGAQTQSFRGGFSFQLCDDPDCSDPTALSNRTDVRPANVQIKASTAPAGGSVEVSWELHNIGLGTAASSQTQVRITDSNSSNGFGLPRNNVGSGVPTGTILSQSHVKQSAMVQVPSAPGSYFVWVIADNQSDLNQSKLSNDFAVSSVLVVTPRSIESLLTGDFVSPYNGFSTLISGAIPYNNVGYYDPSTKVVSSCAEIYSGGIPNYLNGYNKYDVNFEVTSLSPTIRLNLKSVRPFNILGLVDKLTKVPSCSGKFDTTTKKYRDILRIGSKYYWVEMDLRTDVVAGMSFNVASLVDADQLREVQASRFLAFPLAAGYSDGAMTKLKITSILDHHTTMAYEKDGKIWSFTGEKNETKLPDNNADLKRAAPCYPAQGIDGSTLSEGAGFDVGGMYVGTSSSTENCSRTSLGGLNYDGHPGYDYVANVGEPVKAAAKGKVVTVSCVKVGIERAAIDDDCDAWGFIGIDHGNGYVTQYGHLISRSSTYLLEQGYSQEYWDTHLIQVKAGDNVEEGQVIGYTGKTAPVTLSPHLHFEVLKKINPSVTEGSSDYYSSANWVFVDPYGWSGAGETDPLEPVSGSNVVLWK